MTYQQNIDDYLHETLAGDDDWAQWAESGNTHIALARLGRMVLRNQHAAARIYVLTQIGRAAQGHAERMEELETV